MTCNNTPCEGSGSYVTAATSRLTGDPVLICPSCGKEVDAKLSGEPMPEHEEER